MYVFLPIGRLASFQLVKRIGLVLYIQYALALPANWDFRIRPVAENKTYQVLAPLLLLVVTVTMVFPLL
jgi:hypothetical protein